ncbi:Phosphoribosylaminoimidazole-succinocarboxamide synthase, partial [Frankliniella fusca]
MIYDDDELFHDDLESGNETPPKKKKKNVKSAKTADGKRYQAKWEELPLFKGWLKPVKDGSYRAQCIACNCTFKCGKSELEKHAKGKAHEEKVKDLATSPTISSSFSQVERNQQQSTDVKAAEIMIAAVFAEHNVAIHIIDHLLPVFQQAAKDSKILKNVNLGRTKCTAIIENVIAKVEVEDIVANIKIVPFSVMIDVSTGHSVHKTMCVLVRYFSPQIKRAVVEMLELVELDARDCSAASQFQALKKCIEDKGDKMGNIIGFGCDNKNTMTASSAQIACSKLPIGELIIRITNYIGGSAKRQAGLEEFQEYSPSVRRACILAMGRADPLLHGAAAFDKASIPAHRKKPATEILNDLKNPFNKTYFYFMDYSLNFFNQFNALFQSKDVMIHKLRDKCTELLKHLCQNYLLPENTERILSTKLDDPRAFLPVEEVYLGPSCEVY